MGEKNLYSIIVPIYGVEKYLDKCIKSIVNQSYHNIEIILVDDGSKDNSSEICDYYASIDDRINVIHKLNGGLVSARKAGAEIASGDYIVCVDGDDWVSKDYIKTIDGVVSDYNPDLVCCGYIRTNEHEEIKHGFFIESGYYDENKIENIIYPIAIEDDNGCIFPPQLWAKVYKREVYIPEQLSVNDLIKIGEDGAVVKPILTKIKSLYILDDYLYYYRINDNSMTQNKSIYDFNGPRYIFEHLSNRIDLNKSDFIQQIYRRTARDLYTVIYSQFNRKVNYFKLKSNIVKELNAIDYKEVLRECSYKGLKNKIEVFLLKYKILLPIYFIHYINSK